MEEELRFGPFSILPARRRLLQEGKVVPLGSRAMDILLFLIAHHGEPKTNTEIVRHVWPKTFVDEANLRVHMSALRKALGDRQREPQFIANTPGRGYTFIAPIEAESRNKDASAAAHKNKLDRPTSRIFGREAAVAAVAGQLAKGRMVTIVGPGGIGKSTVAREVISRRSGETEIVWIDFSEVGRGELVQTVVASALGVISRTENVLQEIASFLKAREILLVLDSCEHLVTSIAEFVETLLARTSELRILATSREPLRAEGEWVHRLLALELPQAGTTARDALASPAVQLFVERADACLGGYRLTDEDAPHVIDICTRLDGIALAIELAAGRLETIGVAMLSRSLSDGFRILTRGRRTALARHQTLRATLDWSYQLLPPAEQQALKELSVLPGWFASDTAEAILTADGETDDILASLVAKSLIIATRPSDDTLYRLPDTTRFHAAEKLIEAGNQSIVMKRLAEHLVALFEKAEQELYSVSMDEWSRDFGQYVACLRAALEWAFAENDKALVGVRLTVAALPLLFRLSLLDECLASVTQAIRFLESQPGLDERRRMKLYAALGWPQLRSTDAPEFGVAAWTTAFRIAEELSDIDYQLRALWALWVDSINRAQPRTAFTFTEQFGARAPFSTDPTDVIIGRRMKGATLHWLGQQQEARDQLETMMAEYQLVPPRRHSVRFQFDQTVTARIIHARCVWLLDHQDEALAEIEDTIRYAMEIRHDLSLSNVLAEAACPLALLSGREDLAADHIRRLREHTKALSLDVWHTYADCFESELHLRAGRYRECLQLLRQGLPVLRGAGFILFQTIFQSVEARALSSLGLHEEALEAIHSALKHCDSSGERWCLPELYRVKGLVLLAASNSGTTEEIRACYRTALEIAGKYGMTGWEHRIRASISDLPIPTGADAAHVAAFDPETRPHSSGIAF
ncbi:MAG: transcriptional regulator [Rhizobium sp.]|nr:MAG: transcriptional regulator [Rhizobium sp.]